MANTHEVLILGSGPAGLSTALHLGDLGISPLVVALEGDKSHRSVYTKMSKAGQNDLCEIPFGCTRILPSVRFITTSGVDFTIPTGDRYAIIDYPQYTKALEQRLEQKNIVVERLPRSMIDGMNVIDNPDGANIQLAGVELQVRRAVDCTGVDAALLSKAGKESRHENPLVEFVYGGVYKGSMQGEDGLYLILGPAGGSGWVNPSMIGGGYVDIVFTALGWEKEANAFFKTAADRLKQLNFFLQKGNYVQFERNTQEQVFTGCIGVQPGKAPQTNSIYAVGESAGMTKPKTGQGFDRAIMGGRMAAYAISQGLTPQEFYRVWRGEWEKDALFYCFALARLAYQNDPNNRFTVHQRMQELLMRADAKNITGAIEHLLVDGELEARLLPVLLTSPSFLKLAADVIRYWGQITFLGDSSIKPYQTVFEYKTESH